ncbi:hypothetical protein [Nitratireductor alexandrii]|uniref:hypothetical protein n=1 Tax=Nitratireductor alexandrii TaxID=2448161 RepID=UPI000FDBD4CF|nr:hypothetical protein [Nitratireductor alexandrii]
MWKGGTYIPLPQCPDPALVWVKQSVDCRVTDQAANATDAIHLAAQVGRLDVLSLMIGLLSLAIVVATILGFWFYRGVVDQRAKDEVRELLPNIVRDHLAQNPHVLVEAIRANANLLSGAFGTDSERDFFSEIAATIDEDGREEEKTDG